MIFIGAYDNFCQYDMLFILSGVKNKSQRGQFNFIHKHPKIESFNCLKGMV